MLIIVTNGAAEMPLNWDDSISGSAASGFMCKEARLIGRAGTSIEAILARMNYIRKNIYITFALNNLENARLSGRVKILQAALASLLNVIAIVVLHDRVLTWQRKSELGNVRLIA